MARNRFETARLNAIDAAATVHRRLGIREAVRSNEVGFVDVFEAIEHIGIPLRFEPLGKALGLCLPYPQRGILITTQRSLHIQRFTAAHELGHAILKHQGSVDEKVLARGGYGRDKGTDMREIEADAFAAEFLLPKWLYTHHMRQQGWTVQGHLQNPEIVYQLSLRMNASYEATCWGLLNNDIVGNRNFVEALVESKVGKTKQETLQSPSMKIGRSNVWALTISDNGQRLVAADEDILKLSLLEHASSGYVWDISTLESSGIKLLSDEYSDVNDGDLERSVGGPVERTLVASLASRGEHEILLSERRPWETAVSPDAGFGIEVEALGSEIYGRSRAWRRSKGLAVH